MTILDTWKISIDDLTALVTENPSLRGIMLGYVAEHKLKEFFQNHAHISTSIKHDDHDRSHKSDRVILYQGREFTVEVKSLQTRHVKKDGHKWVGKAQVDGSDRRTIRLPNGSKLNTTLLLRGDFDLLAVNCFAFEQKWCFAFALNSELPCSTFRGYTKVQRKVLIASLVPVSWPPEPPFFADPVPLVERLFREGRGRRPAPPRVADPPAPRPRGR